MDVFESYPVEFAFVGLHEEQGEPVFSNSQGVIRVFNIRHIIVYFSYEVIIVIYFTIHLIKTGFK